MQNKSIRSSNLIITASFLICMLILNSSVISGEFPTEVKVAQYRSNIFISWLNDHGDNNFVSPFDNNSTFEVSNRITGTQDWNLLTETQNTWTQVPSGSEGNSYEFKITELDQNGTVVSVSHTEEFNPILNKSSAGINLGLDITSLSADEFPFIYLTALVDSAGNGIFDLDENNFTVYENDILQDSLFEVFPPSDTNLVATDIVFVFDITAEVWAKRYLPYRPTPSFLPIAW